MKTRLMLTAIVLAFVLASCEFVENEPVAVDHGSLQEETVEVLHSPSDDSLIPAESSAEQPETANPAKEPSAPEVGNIEDSMNPVEFNHDNSASFSECGKRYCHFIPEDGNDENVPMEIPETPLASVAEALEMPGLPNLFRVDEHLYRSGQPVEDGLTSAKALGIKTVLSLQVVQMDTVLDNSEHTGISFVHVPMFPWNVDFMRLVAALRALKDAEAPVLVHCLHGSDRTGLVVAAYRILFHHWSKEEAIVEMMSERFGYHSEFENLVELLRVLDVEALREAVFD